MSFSPLQNMKAAIKHFITVCRHKWYVFKECAACGLVWQGLVHDLSKFSPAEFLPAARYFQGDRSPIEAEKEELGYSNSWLHHKGRNKHHWEYWCDYYDNGEVFPHEMPYRYVVEMICDHVGAGKAYAKEKWTQEAPLKYWDAHRPGRHFAANTEERAVELLNIIKNQGLKEFHKEAKFWLRLDRLNEKVHRKLRKASPCPECGSKHLWGCKKSVSGREGHRWWIECADCNWCGKTKFLLRRAIKAWEKENEQQQ